MTRPIIHDIGDKHLEPYFAVIDEKLLARANGPEHLHVRSAAPRGDDLAVWCAVMVQVRGGA